MIKIALPTMSKKSGKMHKSNIARVRHRLPPTLLMTIHSNRKTQSKLSPRHWCIKIFNQRAIWDSMWLKNPSFGSYNFTSSWRVHFASMWLHNIQCHSKQCKYFHSCHRCNKAPQKPSNFLARLDFLESHQQKISCPDPRSAFRRTRTIRLHQTENNK